MASGYQRDPSLPRWWPGPGAGGTWKAEPADFVVEERPRACPPGKGVRWYLVRRAGRDTVDVARDLARAAAVPPECVSWAGLKDREALVTQRFTVEGGRAVSKLVGAELLDSGTTRHMLRPGDLEGNTFVLRIRGGSPVVATRRLATMLRVPNRFGPQRVSHGAPEAGRRILLGRERRVDPVRSRFALSAWQALLFNRVLDHRGAASLEGDLVENGVTTGPLYGARMRWPRAAALALEAGILREDGLPEDALDRVAHVIPGSRRPLWITLDDAKIEHAEDGFVLRVSLPPGSYATAVLQELL